MSTRINQHGQPYEVDDRGSAYITHLHTQLAIAKTLAEQITRCDKCNSLLASIERDEARDTGFQECRDCSMERHNTKLT